MSNSIIIVCSLWTEDARFAYKLNTGSSTFTTAGCASSRACQRESSHFPFIILIFVHRNEQELEVQAQFLKFSFLEMLPQAQQQTKSKGTDSPALSCSCHYLKTSCSVSGKTFFLFFNVFPVIYRILLAIEFKGASTDPIPVMQT